MTKQAPSYTIAEDGTVRFSDGVTYVQKPKKFGETRISPEEYWLILTGNNAIPGTPAEIQADAERRKRPVDMTFDPEAEARERALAQRVNPNNPIT